MSWSFSIPATPVSEFERAADKAFLDATPNIERSNAEGLAAAATATKAASDLVATGIVGGHDAIVTAFLSGHGNADHVATGNWSKDTVTITLHRTDA